MQLPPELAIPAHLDVDALIERQSQQVERLVDIRPALGRHLGTLAARGPGSQTPFTHCSPLSFLPQRLQQITLKRT